jgi:hypothetical protein
MTSRLRAFASVRAIVAGVGLSLVAAWALADSRGSRTICCFTQLCGSQSVTEFINMDCKEDLGPKYKCDGDGGCDPIWADAFCVEIQPVGPR